MNYTREQILQHILALAPIDALMLKNGNRLRAVRTQVYDGVIVNGNEIALQWGPNNSYVAGYVRVSTPNQVEDGFSDKEQAEALIDRCISERKAFAVFSDVKLSGGLPYDNETLISQFRDQKAAMYEKVFRAVFLSKPDQETPENIARMETYLEKHLRKIRNGGYSELFDLAKGEGAPSGKDRKPRWFRPGLTALVQTLDNIHTILVTDLSRLTRSELLMADLLPRFRERDIKLSGVYQDLDWINRQDDLGCKIMAIVYTHMAEKMRYDVLLGDLRGIRQKLVQGIYHGKGVDWVTREGNHKNGQAVFVESQEETIRYLIGLYLGNNGDEEATVTYVRNTLNEEGRKNRYGRVWNENTIYTVLDNPALLGYEEIFGKWWLVYPPLIDEDTWKAIRAKRERRAADHKRRLANVVNRENLMSGLMRCHCGYHLVVEKTNSGRYYVCNAVFNRGHIRLQCDDVDTFFNTLMHNHSEQMIDYIVANSDGESLMNELRDLEMRSLESTTARKEERIKRENELKPVVAAMLPQRQDDPEFENALKALLKAQTRDLDKKDEEEQKHIKATRERLANIQYQEQLSEMKSVVRQWSDLSIALRNKILKDIFVHLQVQGQPPTQTLEPVFRVPSPPDVISIAIETTRYRNNSWIRRLQNPVTWVYDMLSRERSEENDISATIEPWRETEDDA